MAPFYNQFWMMVDGRDDQDSGIPSTLGPVEADYGMQSRGRQAVMASTLYWAPRAHT